ncbi:MAG: hypothetical protein OXL97_10150 [Chloroflexota bacterium]|nr:hypothetical protein [Chloroflexota bacterium]
MILIPAVAAAGIHAKDRVTRLAVGVARAAARKVREATAQEGSLRVDTAADWFGAAAKERYGDADARGPERKG